MTNREREQATLNFQKPEGRGTVAETFYPWVLTTNRFKEEGMPAEIADGAKILQTILSEIKQIRPKSILQRVGPGSYGI